MASGYMANALEDGRDRMDSSLQLLQEDSGTASALILAH